MVISNKLFIVIAVSWIVICIAGNISLFFYITSSPERPKMKDVGEEKCPGDECCLDATCDGANCKSAVGTFCKNNQMCGTKHFCYHSICKAKPGTSCSKSEDCQSNALCTFEGKCKIRSEHYCTRDKHCESDICENEMCKYRSGENCSPNTCESKSECEDGVCKNRPGSSCSAKHDCVIDSDCENDVCKISIGQSCSRHNRKHCADNAVCEFPFGRCRRLVNMPCGAGECVSYADCTSGFCKIPYGVICAYENECQDNLACSNHRCRRVTGQSCSGDECVQHNTCDRQQCRKDTGQACSGEECVEYNSCDRLQCRKVTGQSCSGDECVQHNTCNRGQCKKDVGVACTTTNQCIGGTKCLGSPKTCSKYCQSDWTEHNEFCYLRITTKRNFYYAKKNCYNKGGELPVPVTASERNFLKGYISSSNYESGLFIGVKAGGNRIFHNIYTNDVPTLLWKSGEPNDHYNSEDCVQILNSGRANDYNCNEILAYFCKKNL